MLEVTFFSIKEILRLSDHGFSTWTCDKQCVGTPNSNTDFFFSSDYPIHVKIHRFQSIMDDTVGWLHTVLYSPVDFFLTLKSGEKYATTPYFEKQTPI